jgi:hypothetical protein
MRKVLFVALLMLANSMLPPSDVLFGQEQSGQKIIFHVTAVSAADASDYCTNGKCSAKRITVEGSSSVNGDSHLTSMYCNASKSLLAIRSRTSQCHVFGYMQPEITKPLYLTTVSRFIPHPTPASLYRTATSCQRRKSTN